MRVVGYRHPDQIHSQRVYDRANEDFEQTGVSLVRTGAPAANPVEWTIWVLWEDGDDLALVMNYDWGHGDVISPEPELAQALIQRHKDVMEVRKRRHAV